MSKPKRVSISNSDKLELNTKTVIKQSLSKYQLGRSTLISESNQYSLKVNFDDLVEEQLLGEGQFGTVYKMLDKNSGLKFAVKRIDENNFNDNEGSNNNYERDIMDLLVPKIIGDYKYLVKYYGALHADGSYWILTEIMDTSLDNLFKFAFKKNIDLSENFISTVSFAVLSALNFMKTKGYMHRDIKPSNILLDRRGSVKVCDFGISGKTENSISKTLGKGCRPYMAPEKINEELCKNGYSIKADVWSLGISLIEIATGVHPYEHLNYFEQTKEILYGNPPSLNSKTKTFSTSFCDFVEKCLSKEESKRKKPSELLSHIFITSYSECLSSVSFIADIIKLMETNIEESYDVS